MKDVTPVNISPTQRAKPKKPKHDAFGGRYLNSYINYHPEKYGLPEEITPSESMDDLTVVLEMGLQSLKRGFQRYPDTPEGLELLKSRASDYFRYITEANSREGTEVRVYPDIEGLSLFLGTTRKNLAEMERTRGQEWGDTIGLIKTTIVSAKKQLADNYKIPPVLAIFDQVNNFGYVNVSEYKLTTEAATTEQPRETPEAISAKYGNAVLEPPKPDFGSPTSDFKN